VVVLTHNEMMEHRAEGFGGLRHRHKYKAKTSVYASTIARRKKTQLKDLDLTKQCLPCDRTASYVAWTEPQVRTTAWWQGAWRGSRERGAGRRYSARMPGRRRS
jgi:hypothetical protein